MKTKKFEFDFNEDAEPVAELRRLRTALSKKYKTVEALMQYHQDRAEEMGYVAKDGYMVKVSEPAAPARKAKPAIKPKKRTAARKTAVSKSN